MKTPAQKPARRGEGTIMRFDMTEMGALIVAMGDRQDAVSRFLLERFETAQAEAVAEAAAWAEHQRLEDAIGAGRLAYRGWMLASPEDRLAELYVRHGDFVPDVKGSSGWRYGATGAFEGHPNVLRDAWQCCVFSRKRRTWTMGDQRPGGREDAIAEGEALLGVMKPLLRKGAHGNAVGATGWRDTGTELDVHHHRIGDQFGSLSHSGQMERIGSMYGCDVHIIQGVGLVKVAVGAFTTLQNDQWQPCFDLLVLDQVERHDHADRTGPFWCQTGPAWSISVKGYSDRRVLDTGARTPIKKRDQSIFPAFATREEAIAYAATLRHVEMDVKAPEVAGAPLRTPHENDDGVGPFARVA